MYKPTINQQTIDQITINEKGACTACPFLKKKVGMPWCKLNDCYNPEFRECELYFLNIFMGVIKK